MYDAGTAPSLWAQGETRSDPLLGSNRVTESSRIDNSQYVEVFPYRHGDYTGTYAHIPSLVQQVSPCNEISPAHQQPATPSPPPLFYDYSEHFQQNNEPRTAVDLDFGQRFRGVKEEYGRIYKYPTRVSRPDEHGFASPIKNQSQGIISSSVTQADNSAPHKEIVAAETQDDMRLSADEGSEFQSDNEPSDPPVSAGDAIVQDDSISDLEDADAAVSTLQSSEDHAAHAVEVCIFRTLRASFGPFPTIGDMSKKSSLLSR